MSTNAPETNAEKAPTAPNSQETPATGAAPAGSAAAAGAAEAAADGPPVPEAVAPGPEPKAVTRKDMSLREFLTKMDDYAPIVRFPLLSPFSGG